MALPELVKELHILQKRLQEFEGKYGLLSEDFYTAMKAGELKELDETDEIRLDFLKWMGVYEMWLDRFREYQEQLRASPLPALIKSSIHSTI